MKNKAPIIPIAAILAIILGIIIYFLLPARAIITNFEECSAAGYPIMESYPRQCRANCQTFTEDISTDSSLVELFRQKAIEKSVAMPIEGFDPPLYQGVFPGLIDADFDNAQAIGGRWEFQNNNLQFIKTSNEITSADGTLTDEGIEMLIENAGRRLNIDVQTEEDLNSLISLISGQGGENEERIYCAAENRNAQACIAIYQPVCGWFNPEKIQCIRYPCAQTYSNSCV